jgi:hypothetical protein
VNWQADGAFFQALPSKLPRYPAGMSWLHRLQPQRAFVAVSLREGLTAVRVEPPTRAGGRPRVTLAVQHRDAAAGARALRAGGFLRAAQQIVLLPTALRTFHSLPRPEVPDSELNDAVRWQLAPNMDHAPEEALVQVLPLPALSDSPQRQLLAVVAHGPTVRAHIAPLHAAGWTPSIVDIEETAQRNLMLMVAAQEPAVACVGFADDDALITLVAGGELCLTRSHAFDAQDPTAATERLALQVQRALDGFERQTTQFAVRSLLLLPGPLGTRLVAELAAQVSARLSSVPLAELFDVSDAARACLEEPTLYAHLLGSTAGRLAGPAGAAASDDGEGAAAAPATSAGEPASEFAGESARNARSDGAAEQAQETEGTGARELRLEPKSDPAGGPPQPAPALRTTVDA